jgi:hypothetical protein
MSSSVTWYPASASRRVAPRSRSTTDGSVKKGATTPIVEVRPVERARAAALGS